MKSPQKAGASSPSIKGVLSLVSIAALATSACNLSDPTPPLDRDLSGSNTSIDNSAMNNQTTTNNTIVNNAANNTASNHSTATNNTTPPTCTEDAMCDDGDPCTVNTCSEDGVCVVARADDGTSCDDGDACTRVDACQAGVCVGADPVTCSASDQCRGVGTCDPTTGMCSDPALEDGTGCDDGDACTQTDSCQSGVCVGADPVVCAASGACRDGGVCDPMTGTCSGPALPDDTACDDGDLCTQVDTCQAGVCVGSDPVTCTARGQCQEAGTCDPVTGMCSNPPRPDDTVCDDGDACTRADTCQAGVCTGADPVTCTALSQCHDVGTCNPSTGVCSEPLAADGTPCDDGDLCSQGDQCISGSCESTPVACMTGECIITGTCDPSTGVCDNTPRPDGFACGQGGSCEMGACNQLLVQQDFEINPTGPIWTYTGTPSFMAGFTPANASPANSPIGIGGSRAWHVESEGGGLTLEFANQQIPAGSTARLQFKLAAMHLTGSSGGPDNLDYVLVAISTDGGATFYPRVRVRGAVANNSTWSYNAATTASVPHLPMTEALFQPQNSGQQEVEGISTVEITFDSTVTQVAVRITARSSSGSDDWLVDNVMLYAE